MKRITDIKIEVIAATRHSEESFWNNAALGHSLRRISFDKKIVPKITFDNQKGLPSVYNQAISNADEDSYLVFIHDDVWIDDSFFSHRIIEGLNNFDIIGVAGNRRILSKQPAWLYVDDNFVWDKENLSGAVAHGQQPFGHVSFYGALPVSCELLDGVLLATRKSLLRKSNCNFDEIFKFHFYDMDFCRTARKVGLTLGTWPIAITHQSGGAFGADMWKKNYLIYKEKWKN